MVNPRALENDGEREFRRRCLYPVVSSQEASFRTRSAPGTLGPAAPCAVHGTPY